MCGHWGALKLNNRADIANPLLLRALHDQATAQGRDAWGYIARSNDDIVFDKDSGSRIRVPQLDSEQTDFILGHCRAATAGSARDNNNNHPVFSSDDRVLVNHNGGLDADGVLQIIERERIRDVDTFAIAESITAAEDKYHHTLRSIRESFDIQEQVRSWAACAIVNRDDNTKAFFVTNAGPNVTIHFVHFYNAILYATRARWIDNALAELQRTAPKVVKSLGAEQGVIRLRNNSIWEFDSTTKELALHFGGKTYERF